MSASQHLVAHRGYPRRYPENTLPSIQAAIDAGARYVEIDIQLSRDGEPVLFHDRDLRRLCGRDGRIQDIDWAELRDVAVYLDGQTRPDWRIAHLQDFVALLNRHSSVLAFVELKRISLQAFGVQPVVERVLRTLAPLSTAPVLISYSLTALEAVRRQGAHAIGAVMDDYRQLLADEQVAALQPEYWFCDIDSLPAQGPLAPPRGKLAVYECTDPARARQVLQRGVNLVETFAIGEMLRALEEQDD